MKEKRIERKRIYTGRLINVNADRVLNAEGNRAIRETVSHPGAVAALPVLENKKIVMVRQYRYAIGREVIEIPAGIIEKGETPRETIQRELKEEIQYSPGKIEIMGKFLPSPGYTSEIIHLFVAYELKEVERKPEKKIEKVVVDFERAMKMIKQGEIIDAKSIIAILNFRYR